MSLDHPSLMSVMDASSAMALMQKKKGVVSVMNEILVMALIPWDKIGKCDEWDVSV